MNVLIFRDGLAFNRIVLAEGAVISADHLMISCGDDVIDAPDGTRFYAAPDGGAIGWLLEGGVPVAPPAQVEAFNPAGILREYDRRIQGALLGKETSMLIYGLRLQYEASTRPLTNDERDDFEKLGAIDLWQTAMIGVRNALISTQDTAAYAQDATWPAAPVGLADFLTGF